MSRIVLLAFIFGCVAPPTAHELASADYGAPPENYEELVKARVGQELIDPYSAVYTFDVGPKRGWWTVGGQRVHGYFICGTLNAKNRLGGYVGRKPYWVFVRDGRALAHEYRVVCPHAWMAAR